MGVSKKEKSSERRSRHRHHGDSDDEVRERSSRHRNRSRSRDRSRSPRERDKDRRREGGRGRERSQERETPRKSRDQDRKKDESSRKERSRRHVSEEERDKRVHSPEQQGDDAPPPSSTSGDTHSLSIAETNKLRTKLGLKPLELDGKGASETGNTEGEVSSEAQKKEDVHAPPKNMGQLKIAEKLKEKMATMKETRQVAKKLGSLRTLGESDSEEDDASSWVKNMRRKEEEKKAAEKKARMLEEMDEEFGIGDLVSSTIVPATDKTYSSSNLKGLSIEHSTEAFREGKQVVLTLKDTGILDDADDVLVNVNIVDAERAAKNVDNKKSSKYNPYQQEDEVDEFGDVKKPALLKKYDEEIEGETKKSFVLGSSGDVDTSEEMRRRAIREQLIEKQVSLATGSSHLASEYYTSEEMVQFKKPKKKRKVRKKLKADDLLPLGEGDSSKDHGSRRDHSSQREEVSMDIDQPIEASVDLKDDDSSTVETALQKTRRLMQRGKGDAQGAAKVLNMLQSVPQTMVKEEPSEDGNDETIVLNTTTEFCRQVGEEEKQEPRRISTEQEDEFGIEDLMEMDTIPQFDSSEGGWSEVKTVTEKKQEPKADDLYQEAEPMASTSVIATLQLAARKGFIPNEKKKKTKSSVKSEADAKRDIDYERQKERERERELSKYEREGSFPEKEGYRPNVRIIHVDDSGRELSIKEAFRFMSHKFHGKGSGKKKTEKRLKKIQEEEFLKSSSSVDTPLNTLSMLKSKQKKSQSPYILLKGAGAQSLQAPDVIGKRK